MKMSSYFKGAFINSETTSKGSGSVISLRKAREREGVGRRFYNVGSPEGIQKIYYVRYRGERKGEGEGDKGG